MNMIKLDFSKEVPHNYFTTYACYVKGCILTNFVGGMRFLNSDRQAIHIFLLCAIKKVELVPAIHWSQECGAGKILVGSGTDPEGAFCRRFRKELRV